MHKPSQNTKPRQNQINYDQKQKQNKGKNDTKYKSTVNHESGALGIYVKNVNWTKNERNLDQQYRKEM